MLPGALPSLGLALAGTAMIAAGLYLLRRAWRRRAGNRGPSILGGWALLAGAMVPWFALGGPDRGIILGILAACVIALAAVMVSIVMPAKRRKAREPSAAEEISRGRMSWRTPLRITYVTLLTGPLAGAAAILLTISFYRFLTGAGVGAADTGAAAFIFAVTAWAALASWVAMDNSLVRKSAVVAAFAAISAAHIFLLPVGGA